MSNHKFIIKYTLVKQNCHVTEDNCLSMASPQERFKWLPYAGQTCALCSRTLNLNLKWVHSEALLLKKKKKTHFPTRCSLSEWSIPNLTLCLPVATVSISATSYTILHRNNCVGMGVCGVDRFIEPVTAVCLNFNANVIAPLVIISYMYAGTFAEPSHPRF